MTKNDSGSFLCTVNLTFSVNNNKAPPGSNPIFLVVFANSVRVELIELYKNNNEISQ